MFGDCKLFPQSLPNQKHRDKNSLSMGFTQQWTFHLFSAHHLVNGGSSKMILIHTILTDVIQIPPLQNRSFNKHGSYLRQNTSLWAESPLGTCPTQTHQSRGRLRAGRSSETLWLSGSWKTGDKYKTINLIVRFSPLLKTVKTLIPPIQRSSSQVWWWQTGEVSRLQYNAVKEGERFPDYPELLTEISQLTAGEETA